MINFMISLFLLFCFEASQKIIGEIVKELFYFIYITLAQFKENIYFPTVSQPKMIIKTRYSPDQKFTGSALKSVRRFQGSSEGC